MPLLNADKLFQQLLLAGLSPGIGVAGDLDADSFDDAPFITHSSAAAHTGRGLWQVTLSLNAYLDPTDNPHAVLSEVYDLVHSWGQPYKWGTVPGVGAVNAEVDDVSAFTALSGPTFMTNKQAKHFQATFNLVVKILT